MDTTESKPQPTTAPATPAGRPAKQNRGLAAHPRSAVLETDQQAALIGRIVNRLIVNNAVQKAPFRPLRLSTMGDYSSWSSLTDRTWFSRYLPPKDIVNLPPIEAMAQLYITRPEGPRLSGRSTLLFPLFAQWFTDGFLMTSATDTRRTTTSHQIDLGQLTGSTESAQRALRLSSEDLGSRGRLISETIGGEEWRAPVQSERRA